MKRFILTLVCLSAMAAVAQPPARRRAAQQQASEQNAPKAAAYRDFPTAQPMPADAAWRRDIYRTIDLEKDENAVLYYPTLPQGDRMNLFTYIFKLLLRGQIKAYDYKLDGNEDFAAANEVKAKALMDRYHIFYESKDGRMRVNDADLPSDEVKVFFLKESTYYDQHTASFHKQVTALCPVLKRGDADFGGTDSQYPMFWVKYSDIAPFLSKLMLMGSNLNNAATMSADDYFTMGLYKGDIYKTTNLQDRLLSSYCQTDTAMQKEQKRIEKQLTDFERHVWAGDSIAQPKDTVEAEDSVAIEATTKVTRRKSSSRRKTVTTRRSSSSKNKKQKESKPKAQAEQKRQRSSGSGYSVRRQRH